MIETKTTRKTVMVETALVCDRCGRRDEDMFERQEYLRYDDTGGYGSKIGDGTRKAIDLCEPCVVEVLGPWLRTEPPA